MILRFTSLAALLTTSGLVWAHPGHGTTEPKSIDHYVLEPIHGLPVVTILAVIAAVFVVRHGKRSRS
jgi:hypothetical protein